MGSFLDQAEQLYNDIVRIVFAENEIKGQKMCRMKPKHARILLLRGTGSNPDIDIDLKVFYSGLIFQMDIVKYTFCLHANQTHA